MLRTVFFLTANGALQLSVSNSRFSFKKKVENISINHIYSNPKFNDMGKCKSVPRDLLGYRRFTWRRENIYSFNCNLFFLL